MDEPALSTGRAGQVIIADKNYYGRDFEAALARGGICLPCPARQGEAARPGTRFFRPLRQVIESVNDTFKGQPGLEPHAGHTPQEFCVTSWMISRQCRARRNWAG